MTTPEPLLVRVDRLVASDARRYAGSPACDTITGIGSRLREPLRVAIAGKAKAGKSTLLNALVGELIAPTGAAECTTVVTWYREGITYRAMLEPVEGAPVEVPLRRDGLGVDIDLAGHDPSEVERVVVEWPASALRSMTLIDTPGTGPLSDVGARTVELLSPDDDRGSAGDAVLYLTPHVHSGDVRFLEFSTTSRARAPRLSMPSGCCRAPTRSAVGAPTPCCRRRRWRRDTATTQRCAGCAKPLFPWPVFWHKEPQRSPRASSARSRRLRRWTRATPTGCWLQRTGLPAPSCPRST